MLTNSRPVAACAAMPRTPSAGPLGATPGRNALDEFVSVIHVEDQDAGAAVLGLIADAGNAGIQQALRALRLGRTENATTMETAATMPRVGMKTSAEV